MLHLIAGRYKGMLAIENYEQFELGVDKKRKGNTSVLSWFCYENENINSFYSPKNFLWYSEQASKDNKLKNTILWLAYAKHRWMMESPL